MVTKKDYTLNFMHYGEITVPAGTALITIQQWVADYENNTGTYWEDIPDYEKEVLYDYTAKIV